MSTYSPQVGDRVRRTFKDGTVIEGTITQVETWWAQTADGLHLYNTGHPEQTELLERPVKLNTAPGTVYGDPDPDNSELRVVRVDPDDLFPWLGHIGDKYHWHEDTEIIELIRDHGWVEFNSDGSKK